MPDTCPKRVRAVHAAGRWSVDMFAMFHCGRPDVLPVGDLAVRKGFQTLYDLPAPPSVEQMEALSEPWRPFRSLGRWLPNTIYLCHARAPAFFIIDMLLGFIGRDAADGCMRENSSHMAAQRWIGRLIN